MNQHVFRYYMNLMHEVKTGCPMRDYCARDVYIGLAMREMG